MRSSQTEAKLRFDDDNIPDGAFIQGCADFVWEDYDDYDSIDRT